jgi:hypothetical protein
MLSKATVIIHHQYFEEMAYQTGNIKYNGSFKNIRQWRVKNDPRTLAGEKGGANRDLIMNNPVFARTRENMWEFRGCGEAVKAIRHGLLALIPEHTDTNFTDRLTSLIKKINLTDLEGPRGGRAICFSLNRPMLKSVTFHEKKKIDFELKKYIRTSHPESRVEANITVNGLNPNPSFVPGNAQYYRIINHLSIISDYAYIEEGEKYEPISALNTKNATTYSDYIPVNTPLTVAIKTSFPEGTFPGESDTVLQCVGIEYYIKSGANGFLRYSEGSMMVWDVF